MFGLKRSTAKSAHPMGDATAAARLIRELPLESPARAVSEAAAWLESIESETFIPNHRLNVVSMIDEAVQSSVEELNLAYIGTRVGVAGQMGDWRVLTDYLDRLGGAYCSIIESCAEPRHADLAPRLPLVIVRAMRAVTRSMTTSWLRYLPPDRGSWEALVRCYRTARGRGLTQSMVSAYATDAEPSCPLHELATAVMLAAAAPQNLTPRQVEIAARIASTHRGLFTVNAARDEQWRHYLFDLNNPGPPARIPEQASKGENLLYFSAEAVLPRLQPFVERSDGGIAMMPDVEFGREFGASEKLAVLEHVLRFWDDSPPSRRDERRRINTPIHVEVGAQALRAALERAAGGAQGDLAILDAAKVSAVDQGRVAALNTWTLTDFSSRGIGARFSRRLDRWLRVGSLVGFRLERSEKWCVAIVRRLRTDARNQTDVGCEILAKVASLVKLEGLAGAGTLLDLGGSGPMVRTSAVMLPEDPQLEARASLLFEPGTNAPGQTFVMHDGGSARRIRLGNVAEYMDGWDRVEFDYAD